MDNMLKMMEKYTTNLEEVIGERTRELEDEKKKADMLLYRMLPALVGNALVAAYRRNITSAPLFFKHFTATISFIVHLLSYALPYKYN